MAREAEEQLFGELRTTIEQRLRQVGDNALVQVSWHEWPKPVFGQPPYQLVGADSPASRPAVGVSIEPASGSPPASRHWWGTVKGRDVVEAVMRDLLPIHLDYRLKYRVCVGRRWRHLDPPLLGQFRFGHVFPSCENGGHSMKKPTPDSTGDIPNAVVQATIADAVELFELESDRDHARIAEFQQRLEQRYVRFYDIDDVYTVSHVDDVERRLRELERILPALLQTLGHLDEDVDYCSDPSH